MRRPLFAALAAALLLSGPLAAADGKPLRIGILNDQSGIYADMAGPGSVIAAQMAVEDFGGKVLGRPIEIVVGDHQNKPDVGSAIVNRWIDEQGVDVIADIPTSSVLLAVQEIGRRKDKLVLASTGGSSDFTGKFCAPTGIHWTYDTYALAAGTGASLAKDGPWFFITADYAFGAALERDTAQAVEKGGGKVVGRVKHPQGSTDFSSYLLQAQGAGAKLIAFANSGADQVNAIKQANEFGIPQSGIKLAGLYLHITDIHAIGLPTAKGLILTQGFYWDLNDETRAWSKRFYQRHKAMPTMGQAGVYSSILHYLKAVQAAGTADTGTVVAQMKATPVDDFFSHGGRIREDGRMVHDLYLLKVKAPDQQKYPWDYLELIRVIPGDEAFRPLNEGGCPLVKAAAN
ncbi:ABC transporter substrate-binding protein [Xanthobacter tagetidis]|uniref:ABC transporter substrate-binding protein n=1 Tax=Xanthobacter tagetidis TaxID=60216 RepID=A0A3L7A8P4_9HYPH|nr:ABC transporter substrate-binding protein [Xanthobacter tagetidis]MBB6309411.1 branched-chain amino acid transport system substrate-binding protein [Xanthobacter tagetidis]RLP76713.1 ABC transporter substrate-binding protein [Xanthobacter tagetidis]